MDEYWVCQHCRSLNRAGAGKCYSCRNKFGSKPKPAPAAVRDAAAPGGPAGPAPALGSLPAASQSSPPAYFSRPVILPTPDAAPVAAAGETRAQRHLPNPLSSIERRISAALAVRPIVEVTGLGYVTAGLLAFVFAIGGLLTMGGLPAATYALQHADVPGGWAQLTAGQQGSLKTLAIGEAIAAAVALILLSAFVGLSTHNTTGLGAEVTLLMPRTGTTMWLRVAWVHVRIAVGLLLPTALIWYGYELPGLIAAVLAIEIAQRHLDSMLDWLERPARHLPDLYRKLGVNSSKGSPLASLWAILFWVANLSAICVYLIVPLGFAISSGLNASGHDEIQLWRAAGYGPGQLAIAAIVAVFAVSTAGTLLTMTALVVGLVGRQRTRRTAVRVGRSRSWLARPGQGSYGSGMAPNAAGMAGAGGLGSAAGAMAGASYLDEDRLVERYPNGTLPPGYAPEEGGFAAAASLRTGPTPEPWQDPRLDADLDPRNDPRPDPREDPRMAPETGPRVDPREDPGLDPRLAALGAAPQAGSRPAPPPWPGTDLPPEAPHILTPTPGIAHPRPPAQTPPIPPAPHTAPPDQPIGRTGPTGGYLASRLGTDRLPPTGLINRMNAQAEGSAGAPGTGAPTNPAGGDQASLNSPSTTSSSSPWDASPDDSSEPPSL